MNDAIESFGALAHPGRLAIFRLLVQAGPDGLPSGEIGALLAQKQNTASVNLAVLARAGLIAGRRDGRFVRYHAEYEQTGAMIAYLLEDCCGGRQEVYAPIDAVRRCMPAMAGTETSDA